MTLFTAVDLHDGHRVVRVISGPRDSPALHATPHASPPAPHWTAAASTKRTGSFLPVWRDSTPAPLGAGGRGEHAPTARDNRRSH